MQRSAGGNVFVHFCFITKLLFRMHHKHQTWALGKPVCSCSYLLICFKQRHEEQKNVKITSDLFHNMSGGFLLGWVQREAYLKPLLFLSVFLRRPSSSVPQPRCGFQNHLHSKEHPQISSFCRVDALLASSLVASSAPSARVVLVPSESASASILLSAGASAAKPQTEILRLDSRPRLRGTWRQHNCQTLLCHH